MVFFAAEGVLSGFCGLFFAGVLVTSLSFLVPMIFYGHFPFVPIVLGRCLAFFLLGSWVTYTVVALVFIIYFNY